MTYAEAMAVTAAGKATPEIQREILNLCTGLGRKESVRLQVSLIEHCELSDESFDAILNRSDTDANVTVILAGRSGLTPQRQAAIARSENQYIRMILVQNDSLCVDVMRTLAGDPSIWIRVNLASRSDVPADIFNALAADAQKTASVALMESIAKSKSLTPEVRTKMFWTAWSESMGVLLGLASRDDLTDDEMDALLASNRTAVLTRLISHQQGRMGETRLAALAVNGNAEVRSEVAKIPGISVSLQERLAKDDAISVRKALAENGGILAEGVALTLARDNERYVRDRLVRKHENEIGPQVADIAKARRLNDIDFSIFIEQLSKRVVAFSRITEQGSIETVHGTTCQESTDFLGSGRRSVCRGTRPTQIQFVDAATGEWRTLRKADLLGYDYGENV